METKNQNSSYSAQDFFPPTIAELSLCELPYLS